jgi:hypothetical protein
MLPSIGGGTASKAFAPVRPRLDEGEGKGLPADDIGQSYRRGVPRPCHRRCRERAVSVPCAARRPKTDAVVGSDVANTVEASGTA